MIQIVRSCRWGRLPSCRRPSPSGKLQVSPQCPLHYRNNRYLDIWCHTRDDVCGPGTDAISNLEVLASTIKEVSTKNIDQALGTGHGSLPLRILALPPSRPGLLRRGYLLSIFGENASVWGAWRQIVPVPAVHCRRSTANKSLENKTRS